MFHNDRKRGWLRSAWRAVYPRGGWVRALVYLAHRVRRLPDSPSRISRGVFAGTLVAFTPLFGLHFLIAPLLAMLIGGNVVASVIFVLVCNPLTFVPIAILSVTVGNGILGTATRHTDGDNIASAIMEFTNAFWQNILAAFTDDLMDWTAVIIFMNDLFIPYLVGGILLGIIAAMLLAWLSHASIKLYQRRKRRRLARLTFRVGK